MCPYWVIYKGNDLYILRGTIKTSSNLNASKQRPSLPLDHDTGWGGTAVQGLLIYNKTQDCRHTHNFREVIQKTEETQQVGS